MLKSSPNVERKVALRGTIPEFATARIDKFEGDVRPVVPILRPKCLVSALSHAGLADNSYLRLYCDGVIDESEQCGIEVMCW